MTNWNNDKNKKLGAQVKLRHVNKPTKPGSETLMEMGHIKHKNQKMRKYAMKWYNMGIMFLFQS